MSQPDDQCAQPERGTVMVCDRCGDVTVAPVPCSCATPYDPIAVRHRLRAALALGAQWHVRDAAAHRTAPHRRPQP